LDTPEYNPVPTASAIENYRFFFDFLGCGGIIGLLLKPITSRMTLYATWTASPLRFLAGFVMGGRMPETAENGSHF
jgi:hypothetical protein